MIELFYSFVDDILAIRTWLLVYGLNETEFVSIKPMVVDIIADITNSSESTIDVQYTPYLYNIEVTVRPADKSHSKYVVSKIEDGISFLREINSGIQNHTNGSNLTVSEVNPPMAIQGLRIYVEISLKCYSRFITAKIIMILSNTFK